MKKIVWCPDWASTQASRPIAIAAFASTVRGSSSRNRIMPNRVNVKYTWAMVIPPVRKSSKPNVPATASGLRLSPNCTNPMIDWRMTNQADNRRILWKVRSSIARSYRSHRNSTTGK